MTRWHAVTHPDRVFTVAQRANHGTRVAQSALGLSTKSIRVTTSKVVALDVANPAAIAQLGSFDVPGTISDSRIVGDVLYVVGFEDASCWSCERGKQTTSVSSLDTTACSRSSKRSTTTQR
jgi:hypothetical protein